ncbi:MAG: RNA 3'-terminal phosphate cyclase [Armatimonadetes bacterium]|nr:RNA 3'-terminal phosphate cyclase [Armatimonadota bacterium]
MEHVIIDGSYGEGGGQILRSSLALSALTGKPLRVFNIRAGRKNPGLRPQHLTSVRAAATICNAKFEGAKVNSTELNFEPMGLQGGFLFIDVSADQRSAGSGTLVFQTIFPALLFAKQTSSIRIIRCGTHVPFSPTYDYIADVFLPMMKLLSAKGELKLVKAGWFPEGGGELEASIQPINQPVKCISLTERGNLKSILVLSALSNLKRSIALRQANQAVNRLLSMGFRQSEIEVDIREFPSPSKGTVVFIAAKFENVIAGFSALGELGKPAEKVADEAVEDFAEYWRTNAPVDKHLADQLILFMALADGVSVIKTSALTQHSLTQIWLVEQFLPVNFEVQGRLGEPSIIRVEGLGFLRQN